MIPVTSPSTVTSVAAQAPAEEQVDNSNDMGPPERNVGGLSVVGVP